MIFKYLFILRESEQGWGAETEEEREPQADSPDPFSQPGAWRRAWSMIPRHDPSGNQDLDTQLTEPPGHPYQMIFKVMAGRGDEYPGL